MSYISLYRKYRPMRFDEVYDQNHVVSSLLGAIAQGKISHAYLFAGPRGTGKTSVARLFVRAVNCKNPQNGEPCNQCESCVSFINNKSLDLLEIDAASNRGIEEIRSLREKVQFAATGAIYKAFIIDEVHMLTKEAFNALLKTLEEPPKNTIFILATTEIQKIPETIVSRCQRFDFRRISEEEIFARLVFVLNAEKIEFDEEALKLIAKTAHGGMRDALSLADQLVSIGGKLTTERAIGFLGSVSSEIIFAFLENLANSRTEDNLKQIAKLSETGVQWPSLIGQIIDALRLTLLASYNLKTTGLLFASNEKITELLNSCPRDFWQRALDEFLEAQQLEKLSPIPELPLELAIAKLGQNSQSVKSEKPAEVAAQAVSILQTEKAQVIDIPIALASKDENKSMVSANDFLEEIKIHWNEILLKIRQESQPFYALLGQGNIDGELEGSLILSFPTRFHADRASDRKNIILLEKTIKDLLGMEINIKCKIKGNKEAEEFEAAKDIFQA